MDKRTELYSKLQWGSTLSLFLLGCVTLGIYFGYYSRRVSKTLNEYLSPSQKIPMWILNTTITLGYVTVILTFISYIYDNNVIEHISEHLEGLRFALITIITFVIRRRINTICNYETSEKSRISLLPALIFEELYINYKLNSRDTGSRKMMSFKLSYSTIILVLSFIIILELLATGYILTFITPQIASRYREAGMTLCYYTQLIMNISEFLQRNILFILLGITPVLIIFKKNIDTILLIGTLILSVISTLLFIGFINVQLVEAVLV